MFDFQFLSFFEYYISLALSGGVKCQNLHRKIISEIDDDLRRDHGVGREILIDFICIIISMTLRHDTDLTQR